MKINFHQVFTVSIVAVLGMNGANAMSKTTATSNNVYYACHADGDLAAQKALCAAAAEYLSKNGYQAQMQTGDISDGLLLEFFLDELTKHKIAGRMGWSQCSAGHCGAKTISPLLETNVMDASVSAHSYSSFVKSLFIVGKPPLEKP